ncbi:hypothetical protein SLA2020_277980 [Shorea laevis]
MVSSTLDSQDPGRRKWTLEEDIKLVQALLEHYNEGNDKQETRLQPGYLKILEVKLSKTLLNARDQSKTTYRIKTENFEKGFSSNPCNVVVRCKRIWVGQREEMCGC